MSTGLQLRRELSAVPESVREARCLVREAATGWGLDRLADDAALLTSELATNAVQHARTRFGVLVQRVGDGIQVDVLDDSPAPPEQREHDLTSTGGRGLSMIAALAAEWGPTPDADLEGFVKGVRFRVAC